jgi:transcriptional regulator with XRE-family HTH domain
VRQRRLGARLSVRALAAATDFSPSFVSQVELGQASPSIGSLQKIAEALGTSLGQLFEDDRRGATPVVRKGERLRVESAWSQARLESLVAPRPGGAFEAVLVTLRRGGRSGKRPQASAREELAFVLRGTLRLEIGAKLERLGPGDAVTLPAGQPRLFANRGRGRAELLLVTSRV